MQSSVLNVLSEMGCGTRYQWESSDGDSGGDRPCYTRENEKQPSQADTAQSLAYSVASRPTQAPSAFQTLTMTRNLPLLPA